MITIQIVSIEHPAGRGHEYVRVFGFRTADPRRQIVEVAVNIADATALIADADAMKEFPEIEVPDNSWVRCLNTGSIPMIHMKEQGPA